MDAVSFHGATKDLNLKFISKIYNKNITSISLTAFLMQSPRRDNLHLFASFSGTDLTTPTVKVRYYGNDHRSWIDIIVLYKKMISDMSFYDQHYFHQHYFGQTFIESIAALSTTINTTPNVTDQVLVFSLNDLYFRNRKKNVHFLIHGKSYKTNYKRFSNSPTNLMLSWEVQFQPIPNSPESLVSLQGESYQLKTYLYCNAKETCPKVKIHYIPNQLSNYRDESHNEPHVCLIEQQISCLNFSSESKKHYYIYIYVMEEIENLHMLLNTNENESQLSWNDASFLCQHMGGSLPIIRSKSELDEFIALLTFSQYIPPQEKVFIGLSTKINSKVKFSFYTFSQQ